MRADQDIPSWRGAGGAVVRGNRLLGVFFALLFLHAGLSVAVQAAVGMGWLPAPKLALWHGHELLFGFAAGMMGGYLVGLRDPGGLRWLLAAWFAARLAVLLEMVGESAWWMLLALFYPLVLLLYAARPFLRRSVRLRNKMLALPPLFLLLAECLFVWGSQGSGEGDGALMLAAAAVIAMMLLVGGRLSMAAINGRRQKQGLARVPARGDARLEYALALCLLGWLVGELAEAAHVARAAAGALVFVGVLRIGLWRPAPALGARRVRLYLLGLGWVLAGLAWCAATAPSGRYAALVALHPAFVGGLAILASSVSLQARLQRIVPLSELDAAVEGAAVLFSSAALARIVGLVSGPWPWLMMAALAWTAGVLVIMHRHLAGPRPAGSRREKTISHADGL